MAKIDTAEITTASDTAERRQITSLIYDLVGSTELILRLDLEDMRDLQRSFHRACMDQITRFGGHLERVSGDGGSAYFGYPKAQEDAVERAILCGLAIIQSCEQLNLELPSSGPQLSTRIGIATGEAVFRSLADRKADRGDEIVSVAVNLATRLQAIAEPNSVLVSELTRQLTPGLFDYEATGPWGLKGFGQPQIAWKVLATRHIPDRLRAMRPSLTPIVGRESELEQIMSCWTQARDGEGQVILLSGEAGIGKSRVIAAAKEQLRNQNCQQIMFQCVAYARDASLHPVIAQLNFWISRTTSTHEDGIKRGLKELLQHSSSYSEERVNLLSQLLGMATAGELMRTHKNPNYIRRQTLECLIDHLLNLAKRRPLLLIFEDIHWIDPTTSELLERLVAGLRQSKTLLLASSRIEFTPVWLESRNVTQLRLEKLPETQSKNMIDMLLDVRFLPEPIKQRILENTDGIPLFIEEMTKSVLARFESAPSSDGKVIDESDFGEDKILTLQDFLSARLDELGPAKEIAQVASVLGRNFSIGIVAEMLARDPGSVEALASEMVELGIADRKVRGSTISYNFRHSLIQDTAYKSLLKRRRLTLHSRAAEALRSSKERGEIVPAEVLAHHYEQGGRPAEAIAQLRIAGRSAAERSANREAHELLSRAMQLVKVMPASPERDQIELELISELGSASIAINGSGAPVVQETFRRGVSLSGRLPISASHFAVMWGWWFTAPNFGEMRRRADHLLSLASKLDDIELKMQAHHCQWATLFHLGEQRDCLEHINSGLQCYKEGSFSAHKILYGGHDPKVCALGEKSLCLYLLGQSDTALLASKESLALAEQIDHLGSITHARDIEMTLHWYRRDPASVRKSGYQLLDLARENELPDLLAKIQIFLGWADIQDKVDGKSVQRIESAIESLRSIGTEEDIPVFSDILSEAYCYVEMPLAALTVLDSALEMSDRQGLKYWYAELLRRKGEIIWRCETTKVDIWRNLLRESVCVAGAQNVKTLLTRTLTTWLNAEQNMKSRTSAIVSIRSQLETFFKTGSETLDPRAKQLVLETLTELIRVG